MRILHLSKFYPPEPGGIENFVFDLANVQVRHGHEVYVISHQPASGKPGVHEILHGVRLDRLRTFGQVAYAPVCPGFFFQLRAVIRQFRPDVIHAHVPNVSAFWLLFLRKTPPIILHWHADVVPSRIDRKMAVLYRFYKPWETALLEKADVVIATSRAYLDASAPLRRFRQKCHVVPLGLDPDRLAHNADISRYYDEPGRSDENFTVLAVGRFAYYKGFQYLVAAAGKMPGVRFVIVGDGPAYPAIKGLVDGNGLQGRVTLPGSVGRETLMGLFRTCDVFCLPSVERTEAFGLVLLEAMYFGKPLITTAIPGSGVSTVNRHNETGLQVPPENPEALAGAIGFMKNHPELRKKMGTIARRRVLGCFHVDFICNEIDCMLNQKIRGESRLD